MVVFFKNDNVTSGRYYQTRGGTTMLWLSPKVQIFIMDNQSVFIWLILK